MVLKIIQYDITPFLNKNGVNVLDSKVIYDGITGLLGKTGIALTVSYDNNGFVTIQYDNDQNLPVPITATDVTTVRNWIKARNYFVKESVL